MKLTIVGVEINEGVSKKTGKPYSMATLHALTPLAPPMGADNVAKGFAGDKFECDANLVRAIQALPFPVVCEVEKQDVMRFGQRQQLVTDIRPVDSQKKAA